MSNSIWYHDQLTEIGYQFIRALSCMNLDFGIEFSNTITIQILHSILKCASFSTLPSFSFYLMFFININFLCFRLILQVFSRIDLT